MKRKFVFSAAVFTAGIYVGINNVNYVMALLPVFLFVLYLLFYKRNSMGVLLLATVMFFCGDMWATHISHIKNTEAEKLSFKKLKAELTVTDFPENGVFIAKTEINGKKHNLRVWMKDCPEFVPGDIIKCDVTLEKPENNKNSTSFNYASYLGGRNIFLTAKAENCRLTGQKSGGIIGLAYKIRAFMAKTSAEFFSGDTLGIFNAMIFGDKRFMTDELKDTLTAAGLSHIAVVSGMHLSVVLSVITFLLYGFLGRKRISGVIMIASVIIFTFITGCGASVIRACIMCVMCLIAQLLYRESDALNNLAAATVVMLIYNPFTICNVGFVLSVLSALGIILFNTRIKSFLSFCPEKAAETLSASISAQIMTVPVVMYLFGIFSPYALISNLFVFIFSSVMVIIGPIFIIFAAVPVVSSVMAVISEALALAIISVSEAVEAIPYSVINIGRSRSAVAMLWFALLYLLCLCKHRRDYLKMVILCMTSVICISVYSDYANSKMRIYPFYYAAGNASVVMLPGDKCILTDCMSAYDTEMFAQEHNIGKFDNLIITGSPNDELLKLLETGMVKNIIMHEKLSASCDEVLSSAQKKNIGISFVQSNANTLVSGARLTYIAESEKCENGSPAMLNYDGWKYAIFGSVTGNDVQQLFEKGVQISADAVLEPNLFEDKKAKLSAMLIGERINGKKEIIMN